MKEGMKDGRRERRILEIKSRQYINPLGEDVSEDGKQKENYAFSK